MTRIEREQMIERYLQGEMTSAQEQSFLIEVASNPELRYQLKASRVVDSAIMKDRRHGTISTGKMRAEIAALAAIPSGGETAPQTPGAPIGAPIGSTPISWMARWGSSLSTGFLALAVAGGLYVAGNNIGNGSDPVPTPVVTEQNVDALPADQISPVADAPTESTPVAANPVSSNFNVRDMSRAVVGEESRGAISQSNNRQERMTRSLEVDFAPVVPEPTTLTFSQTESSFVDTISFQSRTVADDDGLIARDTTNSGQGMKVLLDMKSEK